MTGEITPPTRIDAIASDYFVFTSSLLSTSITPVSLLPQLPTSTTTPTNTRPSTLLIIARRQFGPAGQQFSPHSFSAFTNSNTGHSSSASTPSSSPHATSSEVADTTTTTPTSSSSSSNVPASQSLSSASVSTTSQPSTSQSTITSRVSPPTSTNSSTVSTGGISKTNLIIATVVPILFIMVIFIAGATWYALYKRKDRKRTNSEAYERYGPVEPEIVIVKKVQGSEKAKRPAQMRSRSSEQSNLSRRRPSEDERALALAALSGNPITNPTALPFHNNNLPFHNSRPTHFMVTRRSVPDILTATHEVPDDDELASLFEDDEEVRDHPTPFQDPTPLGTDHLIWPPITPAPPNATPRDTLFVPTTPNPTPRETLVPTSPNPTSRETFLDTDSSAQETPVHLSPTRVSPSKTSKSSSSTSLNPIPRVPRMKTSSSKGKAPASSSSTATAVVPPTSAPRAQDLFIAPLRPQPRRAGSTPLTSPPAKSPRRPLSISPVDSISPSPFRRSLTSPVSPIRLSMDRGFPPVSITGSLRSNPNPRSVTTSLARSDDEISTIEEMDVEFGEANRANVSLHRASVIDLSLPSRASREDLA